MMILSATPNKLAPNLGAALEAISNHLDNHYTPQEKINGSKKILKDILKATKDSTGPKSESRLVRDWLTKQGEAVIDDLNKSYTQTNAAPSFSRKPLPKPSLYETTDQCITDLTTNYGVQLSDAKAHCDAVNGPDIPVNTNVNSGTKQRKSAQFESEAACKSYLTKQGLEPNAVSKACQLLFADEDETKGSRKQAAVSNPPAWLQNLDYMNNEIQTPQQPFLEPETPSIKSAASNGEEPHYVTNMDSSPLSYSRHLEKYDNTEKRRLLQASKEKDELPYYMYNRYLDQ